MLRFKIILAIKNDDKNWSRFITFLKRVFVVVVFHRHVIEFLSSAPIKSVHNSKTLEKLLISSPAAVQSLSMISAPALRSPNANS